MGAQKSFFVYLSTPLLIFNIGFTQAQCPVEVINCRNPVSRPASVALAAAVWANEAGAAAGAGAATYANTLDLLGIFGTASPTLIVRGFGFSIPATKTICSAVITINRRKSISGILVGSFVQDESITVTGVATNLAVGGGWPTVDANQTYTITSGLTPAMVNSATFSVNMSVRSGALLNLTLLGGSGVVANINSVSMTISVEDITIEDHPCPLPVTLTSFNGIAEGHCVDLKWKVESELSVTEYIVQKRIGEKFVTIGSVPSKGITDYQFTDCNPEEVNYYRLISKDTDGKELDMNSIVSVQVVKEMEEELILAPNPTISSTRVHSMNPISNVSVFSNDGRRVYYSQPEESSRQFDLNLENHPNGAYLVQMETVNGVFTKQLILNK